MHNFGNQSFNAAGPRVWNSLPPHLRRLTRHELCTFQASTENISIWELDNHGALWLFAVLRLRNTLTYLLISLRHLGLRTRTCPGVKCNCVETSQQVWPDALSLAPTCCYQTIPSNVLPWYIRHDYWPTSTGWHTGLMITYAWLMNIQISSAITTYYPLPSL